MGGVWPFSCLWPLDFVTRHAIVTCPCFSYAEACWNPLKNYEGVEDILFLNPPLEFFIFFPDKTKLHPWKFCKLCYILWKFQGQKPRSLEIPHDFFLVNPGKPLSFSLTPGNSTLYFFDTPRNSISSTPHFFFWNCPLQGKNPVQCFVQEAPDNIAQGKKSSTMLSEQYLVTFFKDF